MVGTEHSGRCLCGNVQFRATGKPVSVAHCHCESCRRQSAAVVATFAVYRKADFATTEGTPERYRSSPGVTRSFCGRCGTPLTYESDRRPGHVDVFVGAFDRPSDFVPEKHVHAAERVPWLDIADDLPRHPGPSPARE